MIAIGIHFDNPHHDIDAVLSRRKFYAAVAAFVFFVLGFAALAAVVFVNVYLAS